MILESDFFPWPPILCSKCGGEPIVQKDNVKGKHIVGCVSCLGTVEAVKMLVAVRGWNKYQMEVMENVRNKNPTQGDETS